MDIYYTGASVAGDRVVTNIDYPVIITGYGDRWALRACTAP